MIMQCCQEKLCFLKLYINHDEFFSVNVLREYNEMKQEIKNPETSVEHAI